MKRVLIVEDQRMPRENMERMLSDSGRYELAASLSGADIAFVKCCQQHIDLILMDVCTSGSKDGIEAAAEIKAKFPDIKIIIVTSMVEVSYLERARAAGVDSFWYKDISPEALIDVIDRTMAGEHLFPNETPRVKLGLADSTELTAKEIEVLRLICDGLEYDEIADRLDISERTVKYHVSNILSKTGYANRTRLAIAVTNKKFIVPNLPEEREFFKTE
ncbi:MAG: response regulator transcription factor [Lachnospiraceae bacterium]|nr:response regulator transcription factor [Lachnospiraceae bacterium]MDY6285908.1 response regulator transcription factor [Lachnospiraceae bacterium]